MKIAVKKLHPDAHIPAYQSHEAAGFDLHSIEEHAITPGSRALVKTGLSMALEPGYELQIRPRSGLAFKHGITVLNTPGTVDSDYRGEIMVLLINHGSETFVIQKGERIAQGIVQAVIQASFVEADDLSETARGSGGFGSTGK
jgi:dUTP pyrophosphatase